MKTLGHISLWVLIILAVIKSMSCADSRRVKEFEEKKAIAAIECDIVFEKNVTIELPSHGSASTKCSIYIDKNTGCKYIYFWVGGGNQGGPVFARWSD